MLTNVGFSTAVATVRGRQHVVFENATVLGLVLCYDTVQSLLESWESDSRDAFALYRLALRRAGEKAWNVYLILLANGKAINFESVRLTALEENLGGTRKIARSGIDSTQALKDAFLPLVPLQSAPRLEAVDSIAEIHRRTSALDSRTMQAFTSAVGESVLLSMIEASQ